MKKTCTSIRLNEVMQERSLKQVDILRLAKPFCEKYRERLGRNDLSQYVSGKTEPGQRKLFILGKALNLNPAWLMGLDVPKEFPDSEPSAKKNDALADIILKARRDEDLIELMRELCDLSPEHRQSVRAFLTLLKQQNVDNMK